MSGLTDPAFDWTGPSSDPNDVQFGDVVAPTDLDDAGAYDAVLVGEPYDGAVIGRKGAREGPAALRRELAALKAHHLADGPVDAVADLGDVAVPDGDVADVQAAVSDAVAPVHEADALPVFLGGDNSLSYANAAPLLDRGSVGAVSFDAHFDCREPVDGPSSGTPYRQLFDAGLDAFAVVGARDFENATAYHDYVRDRGGTVVTAADVRADPAAAVDRAVAAMDGVDAVHVSLDLDVLDAPQAPGVSAPTPGGLTARELFSMLRRVAGADRVAAFEVVECAPPLDTGDRTARAGARAVAHFLAGHHA